MPRKRLLSKLYQGRAKKSSNYTQKHIIALENVSTFDGCTYVCKTSSEFIRVLKDIALDGIDDKNTKHDFGETLLSKLFVLLFVCEPSATKKKFCKFMNILF